MHETDQKDHETNGRISQRISQNLVNYAQKTTKFIRTLAAATTKCINKACSITPVRLDTIHHLIRHQNYLTRGSARLPFTTQFLQL